MSSQNGWYFIEWLTADPCSAAKAQVCVSSLHGNLTVATRQQEAATDSLCLRLFTKKFLQ